MCWKYVPPVGVADCPEVADSRRLEGADCLEGPIVEDEEEPILWAEESRLSKSRQLGSRLMNCGLLLLYSYKHSFLPKTYTITHVGI